MEIMALIERWPYFRGGFVLKKHFWDTMKSLIQGWPYFRVAIPSKNGLARTCKILHLLALAGNTDSCPNSCKNLAKLQDLALKMAAIVQDLSKILHISCTHLAQFLHNF